MERERGLKDSQLEGRMTVRRDEKCERIAIYISNIDYKKYTTNL